MVNRVSERITYQDGSGSSAAAAAAAAASHLGISGTCPGFGWGSAGWSLELTGNGPTTKKKKNTLEIPRARLRPLAKRLRETAAAQRVVRESSRETDSQSDSDINTTATQQVTEMRPPMKMKMVMMVIVMVTLMSDQSDQLDQLDQSEAQQLLQQGTTAAQPHCDPQTQYEVGERCCMMCSPGTHMTGQASCDVPKCEECGENEYQDKHTHGIKCKRQPYCDPNKHFQKSVGQNKKQQIPCLCVQGFHCSSEQCLTCVPHTSCKPGHGAASIGNQTHDTVCQKCPEGWFSTEDSWSDVCQRHAKCQDGYHVKQSGTDKSDNICEKTREHILTVVTVAVSLAAVIIFSVVLLFCRGNAKTRVKGCVESCRGETWEIHRDPIPITAEDDDDGKDTAPVRLLSQEEGSTRTPVEDLDEHSEEMSLDPCRTENGNYVGQEMGKAETLSRQESQTEPAPRQLSQTHTFTS
ncbi:hypothetical protein INR49_000015 [Caranx melampygus]|nr:hypothetical protein INR49_000015 [Caranx melampygus]